jgi:hypothetical protein
MFVCGFQTALITSDTFFGVARLVAVKLQILSLIAYLEGADCQLKNELIHDNDLKLGYLWVLRPLDPGRIPSSE